MQLQKLFCILWIDGAGKRGGCWGIVFGHFAASISLDAWLEASTLNLTPLLLFSVKGLEFGSKFQGLLVNRISGFWFTESLAFFYHRIKGFDLQVLVI